MKQVYVTMYYPDDESAFDGEEAMNNIDVFTHHHTAINSIENEITRTIEDSEIHLVEKTIDGDNTVYEVPGGRYECRCFNVVQER